MDYLPDKFDVALMLWDDGEFLAIHIGEEVSSLYRYNDKLYVIWYTKESILLRIEIVDAETARKMFRKFQE